MVIKLCAFADEASNALEEQIKVLKENNISLLELRNVDGQNIADISEEKAREIKTKLDENKIKVFSIGSPIGKIKIADDFTPHLAKLEHILKLCKILDCKKIRIFSFFTDEYDISRSEVISRLRTMVKLASKDNVDLYHENEKEIYADNIERVIDVLDNVSGLKSIFDPANYLQCGQDIDTAYEKLHARTDYFHIKDAVKLTGELVPSGYGDGKIEKLVSMIVSDKVLTIEPHLMVFDGYSNIDNTEMKTKFFFSTNRAAFDAACGALKSVLKKQGYAEINGKFVK